MGLSTDKITNQQIDKMILESKNPRNSLGIVIPYSYMAQLVKLNWNDVLFAFENGYLANESFNKNVIFGLENDISNISLVDFCATLAGDEYNQIHAKLVELAKQTSMEEKYATKSKLLYVLLSWIFDHKDSFADPLRVVEIIYDDFDFPAIIANFVRYMPPSSMVSPDIGNNIDRLYNNWSIYLEIQSERYAMTKSVKGNE